MGLSSIFQRTVLISVYDKKYIVDFSAKLIALGFRILSTGGTAKVLEEHNIPVTDIALYTGEEEMLSGRVKTIHPKIFGGILFDRKDEKHLTTIAERSIAPIDMVVVNFYPFAEKAVEQSLSLEQAINYIDIGGPSLLRSAAKNWENCLPVCSPCDYDRVIDAIKTDTVTTNFRKTLAGKVFTSVAQYDRMIGRYFADEEKSTSSLHLDLKKIQDLKYGENPQQEAALYQQESGSHNRQFPLDLIYGPDLSYNNLLDLDSGYQLLGDLSESLSIVILKHTNPCGVAQGSEEPYLIYQKALSSDPKSAFGGVVMSNMTIDQRTAEAMSSHFFECIAAPNFSEEALQVLRQKKRLRLVKIPLVNKDSLAHMSSMKNIFAGVLVQKEKETLKNLREWKTVTDRQVDDKQRKDLFFSMQVAKHVKSNAIVICKDKRVLGIGAGQMSRIDSAQIAIQKALDTKHCMQGSVVASDGFFPFKDCVDLFANYKIAAIVQPGGSIRDQDSIQACNEHKIAMLFSINRFFKH